MLNILGGVSLYCLLALPYFHIFIHFKEKTTMRDMSGASSCLTASRYKVVFPKTLVKDFCNYCQSSIVFCDISASINTVF